MDYLIVRTPRGGGAARLDSLENVPDDDDLMFGVPRAHDFPDDASLPMNPDFPKDIKLKDALRNVSNVWVVSGRLKDTLEAIPGALYENEALPVRIVNHKGRVEKAPYFIIHQLHHTPCLDEERSVGTRMAGRTQMFQFLEKLVLAPEHIDPKRMLFRAEQYPDVPIIRRELAEKLLAAGLTNLEFVELDQYKSVG